MNSTTMDNHGANVPAPAPASSSRLREIATGVVFLFGIGSVFTALVSVGLLVFVGE